MSETPTLLRTIALVAAGVLLLAIGKPAVAGLALRGLAVFVVSLAVGRVAVAAIGAIEPVRLYGRRADPRPPNDLPRRVSSVADTLRLARSDDPIPAEVLRTLRDAFQHRLWRHHHLSTAIADDQQAIRGRVSPYAAELLWPSDTHRRSLGVPTSAIPDLIDEVERL